MEKEHLMALGRIEGKLDMMLDNQKKQDGRLDAIDTRLRKVETRSAGIALLTSGMVTCGVLFAKDTLLKLIS